MIRFFLLLLLSAVLPGCETSSVETPAAASADDPATVLLRAVVDAHGGARYDTAAYRFVFRGTTYELRSDGPRYDYRRTFERNDTTFHDRLTNDGFVRTANGTPLELTQRQQTRYGDGLNSVIYFATLPHKLLDPAVQLELLPDATFNGQTYRTLGVTFQQAGGGTDYQDNYRYWIHPERKTVDFLAYDYVVDGGGVRFREAYHPRTVAGIRFQDYVNHKAPTGTPLDALPALFSAGELVELSRIETEMVEVLE